MRISLGSLGKRLFSCKVCLGKLCKNCVKYVSAKLANLICDSSSKQTVQVGSHVHPFPGNGKTRPVQFVQIIQLIVGGISWSSTKNTTFDLVLSRITISSYPVSHRKEI